MSQTAAEPPVTIDAGPGGAAPEQPRLPQPPPAPAGSKRVERWFEVVTAIMLGVVAVATAWSGYQSARWSGEQAAFYAEAGALRVKATRDATLSGQLRLYDLVMTNSWLEAHGRGDPELMDLYERRMRSEFRPTFLAWLALDPFNNPAAPAGPLFMPQYASSFGQEAEQLEAAATEKFKDGQDANEIGDAYVLNTVFLATVLFLTAIAERFEWYAVRAVVLALAGAMLLFGLYQLAVYPIT
jgi:hypothetical protein